MQKYFVDQEEKQKHERYAPWYLGKQYQVVKQINHAERNNEEIDENVKKNSVEEELLYSVFLTKANIENFYGQYIFYKM